MNRSCKTVQLQAQTLPWGLLCARSGYTGARRGEVGLGGERGPGHTLCKDQGSSLFPSGAPGTLVL